jgi:hypothetical protein
VKIAVITMPVKDTLPATMSIILHVRVVHIPKKSRVVVFARQRSIDRRAETGQVVERENSRARNL